MTLKINKIYQGDCLELMKQIDDNSVDLVITSPPYDNLRKYEGFDFDFKSIVKELFRIIKEGGVIVWVVGDQCIDGSETGTSFKQALYFKEIGFNLHDTMIYMKDPHFPEKNRYYQCFEYMFIFSKGKPKTFKALTKKNNWIFKNKIHTERQIDGSLIEKKVTQKENSPLYNIWYFDAGYQKTTKDDFAYEHPAMFPEKLAEDNILSWSVENDLVLDIFCGSGTTLKMAKKNSRNFIGMDISEKYCDISNKRVNLIPEKLKKWY